MTKFVSIIDRGIVSVLQALEEKGINKDAWDDVLCLSLHANALLSLEGVQGLTSLIELNVRYNDVVNYVYTLGRRHEVECCRVTVRLWLAVISCCNIVS